MNELLHGYNNLMHIQAKLGQNNLLSWGWLDESDDTALQTQDSKLTPCSLRTSTVPLDYRGFLQYWIITSEQWRKNKFCFLETWMPDEPSISSFNQYTRPSFSQDNTKWRHIFFLLPQIYTKLGETVILYIRLVKRSSWTCVTVMKC